MNGGILFSSGTYYYPDPLSAIYSWHSSKKGDFIEKYSSASVLETDWKSLLKEYAAENGERAKSDYQWLQMKTQIWSGLRRANRHRFNPQCLRWDPGAWVKKSWGSYEENSSSFRNIWWLAVPEKKRGVENDDEEMKSGNRNNTWKVSFFEPFESRSLFISRQSMYGDSKVIHEVHIKSRKTSPSPTTIRVSFRPRIYIYLKMHQVKMELPFYTEKIAAAICAIEEKCKQNCWICTD